MRRLILLIVWLCAPTAGLACDRPVCQVDPATLPLARQITFDDQPSGFSPGRPVEGVLHLEGASFGEHFAGQRVDQLGTFDRVTGRAFAPLDLRAGSPRRNMAILRLRGTNVLSGDGPSGFPRHDATGEGAIAVLFDRDQDGLSFELRGGEGGEATVIFLRRDGGEIDRLVLQPLAEHAYGFRRQGRQADIAGLVIMNQDPDGVALDTLWFDGADRIGAAETGPLLRGGPQPERLAPAAAAG